MQKRAFIGTLILIVAIAGSFLAFQSSVQAEKRPDGVKDSSSPGNKNDSEMIWENLSRQFFPVASFTGSGFTSDM